MTILIDPWGSTLIENYERLMAEFGLAPFSPGDLPHPNRMMRRGIVFAGKDVQVIGECIKKKKPFYALTGIMPTGDKIHFGNKMVIENMVYFQEQGAETYVLVADLEAAAARGVPVAQARERALQFHIPAYLALGLDIKKTQFYFQSENVNVIKIAFEAAKRFTHNEFRAAYGTNDPGKVMSAVTQMGDMLFPQEKKRMPGIIPVGIDQAVHLRLCRDYMRKAKEKKYMTLASMYHKFTPALDGSFKMSKSRQDSMIELPEDEAAFTRKIKNAVTGGRKTLEEHRKKGAEVEKCMVFELLKQHLVEDDKELQKIYQEYKSGRMTSSEIKQLAIEKMAKFMHEFTRKLEKYQKQVHNVRFIRFH